MKKAVLLFIFLWGIQFTTQAQLKLPAIFADNMVLQQKTNAPIWGKAKPGRKIEISGSWSNKSVTTTADKDGKWLVKIPTPTAGGPYDLSIISDEKKVFRNVMIGEVWICSGQSNMEMPVSGWGNDSIRNSAREIADAHYPNIRLFTVDKEIAFASKDDVKNSSWVECSPNTVGSFSATAYFFGRELSQQLNVPIGLIHTSWGGTIAEAWTSEASLRTMQDFNDALDVIDSIRNDLAGIQKKDSINNIKWLSAVADSKDAYRNGKDIADWKVMKLPTIWEDAGLPDIDGVVWFDRFVDIPEAWAGKDLKLDLGPIDDRDVTYFNGIAIDSTMTGFTWAADRHYTIPGKLVRSGRNLIAVKVIDDGGNGGLYGEAGQLVLYPSDGTASTGIPLSGDWYYKLAATKPKVLLNSGPNQPSVLFNAMIAPLIPFAVKGAIWYQGESNVGRARQYTRLFPLMIKDWRQQWKQKDFPFYFVQIAPFKYGGDHTEAAQLRDAQRRTLSLSPNTGMAVTLDIGELRTIHPANKQDVGKRLALWALNKDYGKAKIVYSGPLYQKFEVAGGKTIVSFMHTEGGLKSSTGKLEGFELQDENGAWVPANGEIKGNQVILDNASISDPKGVRYAFYDTSAGTLFNGAGLPASSFTSAPLEK